MVRTPHLDRLCTSISYRKQTFFLAYIFPITCPPIGIIEVEFFCRLERQCAIRHRQILGTPWTTPIGTSCFLMSGTVLFPSFCNEYIHGLLKAFLLLIYWRSNFVMSANSWKIYSLEKTRRRFRACCSLKIDFRLVRNICPYRHGASK